MACLDPVITKNYDGLEARVPCGACVECLRRRQLSWVLRMQLESGSYEHNSFATLTYDDASRPRKLDVRHTQLFLKRLRWSSSTPIRYFCCGEHGKRTDREHWHMILFGFPCPFLGVSRIEQWPHGGVHFGEVNTASMKYTAGYMLKSEKHVSLMSRRPGIGLEILQRIGEWTASQQKELDRVPFELRYAGQMYPLDRSSRAAFAKGYAAGGGSLGGRSPLGLHWDAYLWKAYDKKYDLLLRNQSEFDRIELKEMTYGKV